MKKLLPLLSFWLFAHACLAQPVQAQMLLREDTAAQLVMLGPFLDPADGTAEGGLTIANTDVRINVNGAGDVAKNSGGCTHDVNGMYVCTFDATDTATVGYFQVSVAETGAVIVRQNFMVVTQAVYDACCVAGSTALVNLADDAITAAKIAASAITNSELASDGSEFTAIDLPNQTMDITGTITTATNVTTVNGLGANVLTAAATAADYRTEIQDADVESVNGVTILGDGSATPFGVTFRQQQEELLRVCVQGLSKRDVRKAVRAAERYGFSYSCNSAPGMLREASL